MTEFSSFPDCGTRLEPISSDNTHSDISTAYDIGYRAYERSDFDQALCCWLPGLAKATSINHKVVSLSRRLLKAARKEANIPNYSVAHLPCPLHFVWGFNAWV